MSGDLERDRVEALLQGVQLENEGTRRELALGILRLLRDTRTSEREAGGRLDSNGAPFDFGTVRGLNRAWAAQRGPIDERTHPVTILMSATGGHDLWRGLIEEVNTLAWLARHLLEGQEGLCDEADGAFTSAIILIQAKATALRAFSMREGWEEPARSSMSGPPHTSA